MSEFLPKLLEIDQDNVCM